jgi:hypothetical protein
MEEIKIKLAFHHHRSFETAEKTLKGNPLKIEKMGGEAALKIWAELRQHFGFIFVH